MTSDGIRTQRHASDVQAESSHERFAIYFAPGRTSAWWTFGATWLGRDEQNNLVVRRPRVADLDNNLVAAITQEPRRYGFHATLKAPFRLRPGMHAQTVRERLERFAATRQAVPLGPLRPVFMDGFVALTPQGANDALQALGAACVCELDDLRSAPTPKERERRRIDPSDRRGSELFERYGYPHVLERFRFHMTLTGPVDRELSDRLLTLLEGPVAELNAKEPAVLDRLCLFHQPAPAAPFRRIADVRLAQ
ncbi:MAG: DUF1045 domain-containing protein [Ramlibacter sp.]